jgi:hypothetical protein
VAILVRALKAADQDGRIRSVLVVLLLWDGAILSGVTAVSPRHCCWRSNCGCLDDQFVIVYERRDASVDNG